jgi:cytochrome c553
MPAYRPFRKHPATRAEKLWSDNIGVSADLPPIGRPQDVTLAAQKSKAAEKDQTFVQELTEKCNRCCRTDMVNPAMAVPKVNGQDQDYFIMALRRIAMTGATAP